MPALLQVWYWATNWFFRKLFYKSNWRHFHRQDCLSLTDATSVTSESSGCLRQVGMKLQPWIVYSPDNQIPGDPGSCKTTSIPSQTHRDGDHHLNKATGKKCSEGKIFYQTIHSLCSRREVNSRNFWNINPFILKGQILWRPKCHVMIFFFSKLKVVKNESINRVTMKRNISLKHFSWCWDSCLYSTPVLERPETGTTFRPISTFSS